MDDSDGGFRHLDADRRRLGSLQQHDVAPYQTVAGGPSGGLPFLVRQTGERFPRRKEPPFPYLVPLVQRTPPAPAGGYRAAGRVQTLLTGHAPFAGGCRAETQPSWSVVRRQ